MSYSSTTTGACVVAGCAAALPTTSGSTLSTVLQVLVVGSAAVVALALVALKAYKASAK